MRLSLAEVVRNRFRARINEILQQQLASQSLDSDNQESVFFYGVETLYSLFSCDVIIFQN